MNFTAGERKIFWVTLHKVEVLHKEFLEVKEKFLEPGLRQRKIFWTRPQTLIQYFFP